MCRRMLIPLVFMLIGALIPSQVLTVSGQATPSAPTDMTIDANDWPIWGGNAARNRNMTGQGPAERPYIMWTFPAPGTSNPHATVDRGVYAGGVLYLPTGNGSTIAIDAKTGTQLWETPDYGITVMVDTDGLIVQGVPTGDAGATLARLSRADGHLVWTAEEGKIDPSCNPVVVDGVGYIPSGNDFIAFDPQTGEVRWRTPLNAPASRGASIADGVAVLGDQQGLIYGISIDDGHIMWTYQTDAAIIGHPSLANGRAYINALGGERNVYYSIDLATGQPVWRFISPTGAGFQTAAVSADAVYLPIRSGALFALDADSGVLLWSFYTGTGWAQSPALVDNVLYLADGSGFEFAIDAQTGRERWRIPADASPDGATIVADGMLFFTTTPGTLYAIGNDAGFATPPS